MKNNYSQAIGRILGEMQDVAANNQIQEPSWWLDRAQMLAALWLGITEDLVKYEQKYKLEIVELIEKGESVASAKLKIEAKSENYKVYKYLEKKDKQIAENIKTAKKRVELENKF